MNRIIFGGAFDPIHLGHINMALEAAKEFNGEVIFVPAKISVWKKESISSQYKVEMINLSIKPYSCLKIDLFEVENEDETTYSIDTVRHFKKIYPNDELFYLIGTDQVNQFHLWKEAKTLSELAHIIFFKRPNYENDQNNISKYHIQEIDSGNLVDVSSSDVRCLKSIAVPEPVLRFIEDKRLYFIGEISKMMSDYRLNHSISVAKLAYEIAIKHKIDNPEKVYIAGILHDLGKEYPDSLKIMEEHYPEYLDLPKFAHHQFVGDYLARTVFNISDDSILSAIKFHCTGNDDMDDVAKILYVADKIDPARDYDSSDLISAMMDNNIDKGFKIVLKANKEFLEEEGKMTYNRLTSKCFAKYL